MWRQYFGNQHKPKPEEKRKEEKKATKRTPPWKEIQPARHPGLQPFLPQDHPPEPTTPLPHPPFPISDAPILSQPTLTTAPPTQLTSSDAGLSRKMLQQKDAQRCSPFPVPSVTLTVPYSPFPIPDAPILSQPPLTTAASKQPTSSNASSSSEMLQQEDAQKCTDQTLEDKSKSTAAQLPLLRWALSVPGLEEPVDLTVDLRAQPPGT